MSYQVEHTLLAKYKIFSGKYKVLQHKPHKNEKVLQMKQRLKQLRFACWSVQNTLF